MTETKISFWADGSIEVQGAPNLYGDDLLGGPSTTDYKVNYGEVALTELQALQAEQYGWKIVGRSNGFLVVRRGMEEFAEWAQKARHAISDL